MGSGTLHRLTAAMLALLLAVLSGGTVQAHGTEVHSTTILVYMNGSDLESEGGSATSDLQEMMAVGSGANLNVVVETLGTAAWQNAEIASDRNQRWLVKKDGLELLVDDLGPRRLDDPATLTDFIRWGIASYPADRYILIFWDHGAGSVDGFGADELHDQTSLLLAGIQKGIADGLAGTDLRFDLIGFDTCLMATVEIASMLTPYANYLVASEELEPGHGWNYTPILQALTESPAIEGGALGQVIADGFQAQAVEQQQEQNLTLSVVDLAKVAPIVAALEAFVTAAGADITDPERINLLAKARSKAEDYGNGHDGASDMVDLGDLATQAAATYPAEAEALRKAVADAVTYKLTSQGKPKASGLAVYFPLKDKEGLERKLPQYADQTPFSEVYKQFVQAFGEALFSDQVAVGFADASPTGDGTNRSGSRSVKVNLDDIDQIAEIYSVVVTSEMVDGSERTIFLSMDNDVEFDPETGELSDTFDGSIVTLNGHFISLFFENETETSAEYSVPIKLNGKSMDLKVLYNFETDKAEVLGAWPGIDPVSHMASKQIIKLKQGDRVVPQFYYVDEKTGKDGLKDGKEFVVDGPVTFGRTDLPVGFYYVGFYVVDFAGNEAVSEFDEYEVVAESGTGAGTGAGSGAGAGQGRKVKLWLEKKGAEVDGTASELDVPPQLVNGSTMVPLRFVGTALGATVQWNAADSSVTYTLGQNQIVIWVGKAEAMVNGQMKSMPVAPVLVEGRTLIPLRFISENLGAGIQWDGAERSILITYPAQP